MQDDNDLSAKPQNIKTDPPESTHEEPLDNELQPQPMPANQQEPEAPHSQVRVPSWAVCRIVFLVQTF